MKDEVVLMKKNTFYRGVFYAIGLLVLALGITLNTKTGLGVSPIISVAFCISTIWDLNFGNITLALYASFVIVEMILHTIRRPHGLKSLLVKDMLQLPLSLIFTRFLNIFGSVIPDFQTAYAGTFAGSFASPLINPTTFPVSLLTATRNVSGNIFTRSLMISGLQASFGGKHTCSICEPLIPSQ